MVNREQEVIDRVHNERVKVSSTEPLRDMFELEPFDESMLNDTENDVFDIVPTGYTHTPAGSLVTPAGTDGESFDLFKLQDDETMDALDPTKEPPADWEPGPEDVDVDVEAMANDKWDELQDGLGIV